MVIQAVVPTVINGLIHKAVVGASNHVDGPISPVNAEEVANLVAKELMKDPEAINQFNAEPLHKSRVAQGASVASVAAALSVILQFFFPDYDWAELTTAFITLGGAGWAFYGRVKGGLRPVGDG